MEEDIKLIEHYMEYYSKDYIFRKAIENLIKGYKELEEENIKIKHLMRNPCDIPRQIIIEKMNKDINTNEHTILGGRRNGKTLEYGIRLGRIQMCEELLQEGDK